jgi:hypothetical protein
MSLHACHQQLLRYTSPIAKELETNWFDVVVCRTGESFHLNGWPIHYNPTINMTIRTINFLRSDGICTCISRLASAWKIVNMLDQWEIQ